VRGGLTPSTPREKCGRGSLNYEEGMNFFGTQEAKVKSPLIYRLPLSPFYRACYINCSYPIYPQTITHGNS
jgi:hypothetical protein